MDAVALRDDRGQGVGDHQRENSDRIDELGFGDEAACGRGPVGLETESARVMQSLRCDKERIVIEICMPAG